MERYTWFKNKEQFQFDSKGIELNINSLKIELLNKDKQFDININNKKYKVNYIAKCKDSENKLRYFAISKQNDKIFVIRIDSNKKYSPELLYKKSDFLSLATQVSRKLKG